MRFDPVMSTDFTSILAEDEKLYEDSATGQVVKSWYSDTSSRWSLYCGQVAKPLHCSDSALMSSKNRSSIALRMFYSMV